MRSFVQWWARNTVAANLVMLGIFVSGRVGKKEHDQFTQEDIIAGRKTMTITIDQDVHLIRDIQAGMHSRGFETQKLCDDEVRIQHYHDWLDHWMGVRDA